jgi:DNA polymerase III epsilon subunit-like protein
VIYVFDTNSFPEMSPLLPDVFPAFWVRFEAAVIAGEVTSTREVLRELGAGPNNHVLEWCSRNKTIFTTPNATETSFLPRIFVVPHFQQIISEKARLRGTPVADPFIIARAHALGGTVVTEESPRPNKPNIPAICQHFGIPCMKLGDFLRAMRWTF